MISRKRQRNDQSNAAGDILITEYIQCNESYNWKDQIAGDLFAKFVQTFSAFAAILVLSSIFRLNESLKISFVTILGIFGTVSFTSILLDMQGAFSAKIATRLRAEKIEQLLSDRNGPQMWLAISGRQRFWEERVFKKGERGAIIDTNARGSIRARELEGILYVVAGRIGIALWIALIVIIIFTSRR